MLHDGDIIFSVRKVIDNYIPNLNMKNPFVCPGLYGERNVYTDYNIGGEILTQENYTMASNYKEHDWLWRLSIYDILLSFTQYLLYSDHEFLSEFLGYNIDQYSPWFYPLNRTVSCYNFPLIFSKKVHTKLVTYSINYTAIPDDAKLIISKNYEALFGLSMSQIDHLIENEKSNKRDTQEIYNALIGALGASVGALIGGLIFQYWVYRKTKKVSEEENRLVDPDDNT